MSYYMAVEVSGRFDDVVRATVEALATEGFGVLTEIDVKATMQKKLGLEYPNYRILGACNPPFAHKAFQAENKIGTMLPCNVIVRETEDGGVEVAAVDPLSSMQAVGNPELASIADEVTAKLRRVVESLKESDTSR